MLKVDALRALAGRDFRRYFGNPTGYVFITLFILLSAAAAFWRPRFFLDNLANLDQLNEVFPYVLIFFVAALTMGVWSEERKQGTDELILTLPARDLELVLGKYAAALGIYTVALLVSLSHVAVLVWLGSPDPGLMASNYLGYWLAGAALIAVGMLASLLTANGTVAFILAALFCAVPVLCDRVAATFSAPFGRRITPLGVFSHFGDFAGGVVSAAGVLYFVSLAALFLYVNVVVLGRRHWPERAGGLSVAAHYAVRVAALAVALVAINVVMSRVGMPRLDATAERLHSLGPETRRLISALPGDRPVLIQAFVSPDMPAAYVQQRENLINTLREIRALAGSKVDVLVQDTAPYSEEARRARERFGIVPRLVADDSSAATDRRSVFLGVAFSSGSEEQVIPFFEHGLSAEYELTRAIRVVARTTRKRLGVIDTDAKVFGGVDFETGRTRLPWAVAGELRRQYDIVSITPYEPIREKLDALLVLLPSTLLQRELDHVFDVIRGGMPSVLAVDPVPAMDMRLAPAAPMAARMNPFAAENQAFARKNTGDVLAAMRSIGVEWPATRVAWDGYRPRPEASQLPPEVVFVGRGSGNGDALNRSHRATSGLQDLMLMYPGFLAAAEVPGFTFEPLAQTGPQSGTASYFQVVQPSPGGPVLNVNLPHTPEGKPVTLAAQVRSSSVNAIVVADLDFVSDQFFAMRDNAAADAVSDNVAFLLNAIDVLTGDDTFVGLRSRRVRHRTLERVEAQTRAFVERRNRDEQQAAAEAKSALDAAQNAFTQRVKEIETRSDLDAQAKQILARNLEETENRKLAVLRTNIELAKSAKIQASRETMETSIRRIQSTIRTTAVLAPPLPMFLFGLAVFVRRQRRQRAATSVSRLADDQAA
jgi:ABC-2 type transport system permease protein